MGRQEAAAVVVAAAEVGTGYDEARAAEGGAARWSDLDEDLVGVEARVKVSLGLGAVFGLGAGLGLGFGLGVGVGASRRRAPGARGR